MLRQTSLDLGGVDEEAAQAQDVAHPADVAEASVAEVDARSPLRNQPSAVNARAAASGFPR
ncbi:hypothetical protein NJ76_29690 [Rhodococcus sp. IITR03]|nr:hypothetical protein NJ76_29690 [Rhodococcus sp. IITR03]